MPLNPARVGHRYASYRYDVCREKIREYALATGVADPAYTDDTADVVAPPTFAACFTVVRGVQALFADPELGAHPALMHGSQEYTWQRALRPGDVLDCSPWIADIVSRGRSEFLTLQIDCADVASGQPAVTSRSTIVFLSPEPQGDA